MTDFYYSLVIFLNNYVEIVQTYSSLELCAKAALALGDGTACIELSRLKELIE
jgi:hypothetical protein